MRNRRRRYLHTAWWTTPSVELNGIAPSLAHDYINNRYYNSELGAHAFPFTGVRTTNAMMFDSQGRLVWAPANMFTNTDSFGAGWTSAATSMALAGISSPIGVAYKLIEDNTSANHVRQGAGASIVTGQTYAASIYLKAAERGFALMALTTYFTTTAIQIDLSTGAVTTGTGSPVASGSQDAGGGWWRVWIASTATFSGSGSVFCNIYTSQDGVWANRTYTGDGASGIYMAAPQFEPYDVTSPKPYVAAGASAYFGQRFNYDPVTLQLRGLLDEETRINIISNSNGTSGWVLTDTTPSKTLTGIERTANTAYLMTEGSAGTAICTPAGTGVTVTAGATCTVSCLFKYQGQRWMRMRLFNNTGVDGVNLWVDLQNAVIGSNSVSGAGTYVGSRVIDYGLGWYRFELTGTPNASYTSAILQIVSASADGSTTRASGAQYGMQWPMLEEKTTASLSIVPTFGGATVTKASDNFADALGTWFDQTKGTWVVEFEPSADVSATRRLVAVNDGTVSNQMILVRTTARSGQVVTTVAGVNDAITIGTTADFTVSRQVMVLNSPTKKLCVNGGTVQTASVTAFNTSGYTQYRVGSTAAGSSVIQGHIRKVFYYPDASASDAQIQAIATV